MPSRPLCGKIYPLKAPLLEFSSIWLDLRWGATGLWLALFALALALTLRALWRPRTRRFHGIARAAWAGAMAAFAGMWVGGAALEMMRRFWEAPVARLVLGMAVSAFLVAGVVSLAREWFVSPQPPLTRAWKFDARRAAWTLSVLGALSWTLGGLILWPFETTSFRHGEALPANWLLAWSGAQMAGAAQLVRARAEWNLKVINPRPATLWLLIFALVVAWISPLAASVVGAGFAAFVGRVWSLREGVRVPRWMWGLLPILVLAGALWWSGESVASWTARQRLGANPLWWGAGAAFGAWILLLASGGRWALQIAVDEDGSARALLWGAGVGAVAALLIFGVAGALFWSFWPLASLFFGLLEWHDHSPRPTQVARRGAKPEIAVSAAGRPTQKR